MAMATFIIGAAGVIVGVGDAAAAGTLYVATTGVDAGTCTQAAPCLTIGFALGVAAAGDTIEIAAGDYPGAGGRQQGDHAPRRRP